MVLSNYLLIIHHVVWYSSWGRWCNQTKREVKGRVKPLCTRCWHRHQSICHQGLRIWVLMSLTSDSRSNSLGKTVWKWVLENYWYFVRVIIWHIGTVGWSTCTPTSKHQRKRHIEWRGHLLIGYWVYGPELLALSISYLTQKTAKAKLTFAYPG